MSSENDLKIELRKHYGELPEGSVSKRVDLKQYRIFANDIHIGYVGEGPNDHISIVNPTLMPEDFDEVKAKVDAILGRKTPCIVGALRLEDSNVKVVNTEEAVEPEELT